LGELALQAGGSQMFDTDVLVGRECILQAVVVLAISRNIPLETLEQIMVLRCRFFHAYVGRSMSCKVVGMWYAK
jgi:hypothetical protein